MAKWKQNKLFHFRAKQIPFTPPPPKRPKQSGQMGAKQTFPFYGEMFYPPPPNTWSKWKKLTQNVLLLVQRPYITELMNDTTETATLNCNKAILLESCDVEPEGQRK